MSNKAVIFGATSLIAEHTARLLAAEGWELVLVGRHREALHAVASHLRLTGCAPIHELLGDAANTDALPQLVDSARQLLGHLDLALIAWGCYHPNPDARQSREMAQINYVASAALAELLGRVFAQQHSGTLAVISSVAGDVRRSDNYAYGSTKAALTAYLQGLRQTLSPCGVNVLTIKPGRVENPLTAGILRSRFSVEPATIAAGICRAIQRRKSVVYLPGYLRVVFFVLRSLPEWLLKRLRF
ncbi:MAG: SDR family NAD(P)-dependent oxidoreductase [Verrucomicrobia bacterium]|nr:SDR family NAD(P)-dependent oxidoreductase [Verrucomicrobiota bacterium]